MEYTDYRQAVEYNKDLCSTIAMEENAELIQAISKAKRCKLDKDNLAEEIADVLICIDWIQEIYKINPVQVYSWIDTKTERIVKRLNNGEFK
ncbi:MazG nucleotide pyrophosphohydrolase domain-containing protein [Clostridium perfringens]|uniref:MazG nucleotide pyrophosphohydrolase domain-containing protein n=1 Tax=Clostridium perfringens TaxID=1502 RepID=UPI00232F592C|nr:MazG nucleotide pyrophosphohydrolase domain-containing protein [Clostridium perfringens]MDB2050435.1 MazG nucleotide pyrophosphohydrolase domain-containing protein [Clostridium perfringens]